MSVHRLEGRGPGRPKGSPNKAGAQVKEALLTTFKKLGGIAHMREWASTNPTEFYKLLARIIPHEISGIDGEPIAIAKVERAVIGAAITANDETERPHTTH